MNKFQILFFLFFISFYAGKELNLDFLNYKTIDSIRQITWSSIELIPDEKIQLNYKEEDIFFKSKYELINKINQTLELLLKRTNNSKEELINMIEENRIFKVENETDSNKLINNENIPKLFLINFAFNIDKYSRTENQEINSAMDYINYLNRNNLKKFLFKKLKEFPNLNSPDNFKKYILNDINFNFPDIDSYIRTKSKKEMIQYIYGFEKYCFSTDNDHSSFCSLSYQMYNHDSLDSYTEEDLKMYIAQYRRKLDFNYLDKFISIIENRGFSYIYTKQYLSRFTISQLVENVKAFETYFNKHLILGQSLNKRDEYINNLTDYQLRDILEWAVDLYPELNEKVRFKDIISNQINLQYGRVKDFLKISERSQLLKYAYNIHTFQNNITSKYDNDLINFIRLNDEKLYNQIFIDTNNNILLQEKKIFERYANLYEHDIKEYLKSLQRNQLKIMTKKIINCTQNENQDGQALSKKKNLFDSIENMSDENLLKTSFKYAENAPAKNIFDLIYLEIGVIDKGISFFNFYFFNIMDFFRSTDINYLRLWLRKYELEIRKLDSQRYIAGGLKNNFINFAEYPKKELLKIFDIYVNEYPQLFYPEKFIKITGLDNGITPHKFLVENMNNTSLIEKILLSLVSYMQIKNIQINFDYNEYLSTFFDNIIDNDANNDYFQNNFIYSVFRIINIFPELNNMLFFEKLCLNNTTRILNFYEIEQGALFNTNRDLKKIKENIKYYYEMTNSDIIDNYMINEGDSEESYNIQYIQNFVKKQMSDIKKNRVIHGDFYYLFYDFSLFLKDESEIVIKNIYEGLFDDGFIHEYNVNLNIKTICETINKYDELQNITFFDSKYNYINIKSEQYENVQEIYNYLKEVDNRQLFYYCILANLIKIDYDKKHVNNTENQIPDIYLKIHYMSRNSMIRYILNIAKFDIELKNKLSETNLRKLTKKYMLDLGSDNVYDLTMY